MTPRTTLFPGLILLAGAVCIPAADPVSSEPLALPGSGRTGYQRLAAQDVGLVPKTEFHAPANEPLRQTHLCGLATGDVDGDGLVDLFVCGMQSPNALYRNQGGWKFEDVTVAAGVACQGWRLSGAVFADTDGDGDLDLVLTSVLDNRSFLYLNDGRGRFTESRQVGWIGDPRGGNLAASLADVDGDGDLDLYTTGSVKQYLQYEMPAAESTRISELGRQALQAGQRPPELFFRYFEILGDEFNRRNVAAAAVTDHLYLNDGHGAFRPVTDADRRFRNWRGQPIRSPRDPSHEAAFRDVDGDGDPDLYVTADFDQPDRFWINDGRGVFRESDPLALRRTSQFSMGMDFADINRDGHLDFITVDMLSRSHQRRKTQMGDMQVAESAVGMILNRPQIMQNTLQLNRGDGTWSEIAQFAGVKATEWSWGTVFTDVDLDGYEDLIIATGMTRDFMDSDTRERIRKTAPNATLADLLQSEDWFPALPTRNLAYRNRGNLTFADTGADWGFDMENVSGGIAQADFDNDGDLDLIFNCHGTPPEIYRNESVAPRIAVRLIGLAPNTAAIGAKVRLLGGPNGTAPMEHEIHCGGGYASGTDPLVVFGSGSITSGMKLEIIWRWRDEFQRTIVPDVRPNRHYTIRQEPDATTFRHPATPPAPPTLFRNRDWLLAQISTNAPGPLPVRHTEAPFDDFVYQPLLPNRLSQLGPGAAWTDLDGDGFEDLVVGSGRGGKTALFYGRQTGNFRYQPGPVAELDQTTVLSTLGLNGKPTLLIGQSNFETPDRNFNRPPSILRLAPAANLGIDSVLAGVPESIGPLAQADIDGDGDLDLFVGGRCLPSRYPAAADSRLYRNDAGRFVPDTTNSSVLRKIGLVSGAVFGDLDGDGDADLVLALEWGPIRVFRNTAGKFSEATADLGLASHTGWWNSVTLGDLDGDGRLDIIAGNWGRNTKYEQSYSDAQPLRIAYADFDTNGVMDIVEYHFDHATRKLVPERGRSCSTRAMPFLANRNASFTAFGSGSLEEVYGQCLKAGTVLEAKTLEHRLFLNRGMKFEPRPLPPEAQLAPIFGINVADFDGDGNEDVFVAQNFFAAQKETPRCDAGRGLLLLGDGQGGLDPMDGSRSGLKIYGEQRGSAVADYNRDGRPDLAVTQNGTYTRLYENTGGRPGIRVRLRGQAANPTSVGAILRLQFADKKSGPARSISAGSGYWSQDSAVQVLATPQTPTHVSVTWPGGQTTRIPVPDAAREITVAIDR
jgi:enediyne biosynthesis protein E4